MYLKEYFLTLCIVIIISFTVQGCYWTHSLGAKFEVKEYRVTNLIEQLCVKLGKNAYINGIKNTHNKCWIIDNKDSRSYSTTILFSADLRLNTPMKELRIKYDSGSQVFTVLFIEGGYGNMSEQANNILNIVVDVFKNNKLDVVFE
ncbi:MAG: hypothetical protein ACPGJI_00420 [Kangiellaceae bacterium]